MPRSSRLIATTLALSGAALPAVAQDADRPHLNFYGVTGLIDMPTGETQPDGRLSTTVSYFGGLSRTTLSFQVAPRISASFRYSGFQDLDYEGFDDYFDRSFDLTFQLLKESAYLPALKVGFQDFAGTGVSAAEYVAATKTFGPDVKVTAGVGWGRFGSANSFGSPFGERDPLDVEQGGEPNVDQFFRGPAAPFAGISWQATDDLTLMAEYSSDAYDLERGQARLPSSQVIERRSSVNLGLAYRWSENVDLGAYYLYGSELGVRVSFSADPQNPPLLGSRGPAPTPVQPRPQRSAAPEAYDTAWTTSAEAVPALLVATREQLEPQGIRVQSLAAEAEVAEIRIRNQRYDAEAQAIGRTARALTRTMPASVETFRIVPVVNGIPASAVVLRRSDVEALETAPDGADQLLAVTGLQDAGRASSVAVRNDELLPRFTWNLGPYVSESYFDPESPVRAEIGAKLSASYEAAPGLVFSGAVSKSVVGNIDEADPDTDTQLPAVRTDSVRYAREGDPSIDRLQAAYYFDAGPSLYGRVTAGYLEKMFGGVSTELLWKPVDSRLGLGAELNYVKKRDYDGGFGFRDYDVATGHVSAYYDIGAGYHAQLDVGRYLAGDYGATIALDREFNNGWSVGAFATFTDVSAEEFGEGSFDKGIRVSIPFSWFLGEPTRNTASTTIRPIQRDGGARLSVSGRLYDQVRDYHRGELAGQWGRVWR
ncbi:Exopolysaccharide biosynthesis protein YbjH [Tranquillimonas rosea]|uniref:Exopolysaccharide biosynthesis protein YbjH n=1 Tax=Tranquillimonas rosea TaxID=641238 RepID=A0A1H9WBK8_9RHOB|nr:YjbH domain-containing protein [Tranquillimonas rosea]SES31336.1 Exopolysaccharide biosynthesis protein YbjH [Tranquillimonas rosea]